MGLKDRLYKPIKAIQEPANRIGVIALVALIVGILAFAFALGATEELGKLSASKQV